MIKTHKIKVYPNFAMRKELDKLFNYRRFVWNLALETWNDMYDVSVLLGDKKLRPNERKVRDELVNNKADWQYCLSARVLQETTRDLGKAWNNFFNPKMPNHERPNFKSKKRSRKTFKTDRAKIVNGKLRLDKPRESTVTWYDIRMSEQPRWDGALKMVTVSLDADGYYVSLNIDVDVTVHKKLTNVFTAVDANIRHFNYKDANGYQTQNTLPNRLIKLYDKITLYQRRLARKRNVNPKGFNSKKYRVMRAKLKRTYQDVKRMQEDLLHKFTIGLVSNYDVIGIENLDINHMKMNKHLAKNLHRSMFGKFKEQMKYKAEFTGANLVLVDQMYPSTQRCSQCGYIKTGDDKIGLDGNKKHHTKHDEYWCYACGAVMERDENAVENLMQYAEYSVQGQAIVPVVYAT